MARKAIFSLLAFSLLTPGPVAASEGSEWDEARAQLIAEQPGKIAEAIARWRVLNSGQGTSFDDYAGFLLAYPGFPEENRLRTAAEQLLDRTSLENARLVAYFDRYPPLTNPARARYALALFAVNRAEAAQVGLAAWRGGAMSEASEAALSSLLAATLTPADHDRRMEALLWANNGAQAERQIALVSPAARPRFMARLALLNGQDPETLGLAPDGGALADPGYLYNRARQLRASGNPGAAATMLATRPKLSALPLDQRRWVSLLLAAARTAGASEAAAIAGGIDEAFAPGADVSALSYQLRDDYTSLVWLGGTTALWRLGDAKGAAPHFVRYAQAARSPGTRAKGFYWAGRALAQAGDRTGAASYFEQAGGYADHYYAMLALERLGRPLPPFDEAPHGEPTPAERVAFQAKPITAAVRELAREGDWPTTVRFFREICDQAVTQSEHLLVAEYARQLGRRDLAVILGQAAHTDGYGDFHTVAFPLIPVPPAADWTMVHAITRQESQFAQNAVSHAGARGLMQLMPATAREQATKDELAYDVSALVKDAGYNLMLGNNYYARLMDRFSGSYPLAVAAYNAGGGNVNKWLRANGDPRQGGIDWVEWIEKIPISETRNYVQRVLENAVVYEAMNPAKASYKGANPLSHFLGKSNPG